MSETQLVAACLDYLKACQIFAFRLNTGAFKAEHGSFIRFGSPGASDIIAIVRGQFVGIECKVGYNKMSDDQKIFQHRVEAAGGKYILVYSIDDLLGKLH